VDFDLIKQGRESGEGDEWFGKGTCYYISWVNQIHEYSSPLR
jgi:hypothetical protein